MRLFNRTVAILALALLASACTGRLEPRGKLSTGPLPSVGSRLERAPECRQAGDLCDRMIDELNQLRTAVPNADFSGNRRLTLSGDGRFILTATLIDPKDDPKFARNKIDSLLQLQGWTRESTGGRPAWRGDEHMTGWLFTFEVTAQGDGSKIDIALYAPKP